VDRLPAPNFNPVRAVIPERNIWRAATLLIGEHRGDAELVAARRADEMLEDGDRNGKIVWLRIKRAIGDLLAAPVGKPH
jgi:hypothetical protein